MADHRLITVISNVPPNQPYFSLEFFPPKTQAGFTNLQSRLSRMAAGLRPLYVTVTWGAGGSTSSKSLELAEVCQRQLGLPTVLHLTCTNMQQKTVDEALEVCKELGVRNILALRGDPPRPEYRDNAVQPQEREFEWAIDLVKYIRKKHGDYFCIGVAGYPEGHADESHPEAGKQSVEHDLPYLVDKVEAGADFIMTQLTYDLDAYAKYESRLRNYDRNGKKVFAHIPVIPGLMIVQSYQIVRRITKLSHAKMPAAILDRIDKVKTDDEAVKRVGVDIVSELVEGIKNLPQPQGLARGLHFYTLNLEKSLAFILERCNLIPPVRDATPPDESSDSDAVIDDRPMENGLGHQPPQPRFSRRRASSVNAQPHNRVILDSNSRSSTASGTLTRAKHEAAGRGTGIPASDADRKQSLAISEGQGSLGREATWDDFPNGRWGPAHSPAYGEIDGYGPSLKCGPATSRRLWGHPKSISDVTSIFKKHVLGDIEAVPWSDEIDVDDAGTPGPGALRAETKIIRNELLSLIENNNFWTLASQPAVDSARSDDETFGWGPKGEGFVFQKAFVEFFCLTQYWEESLKPKLSSIGVDELSWMKTDVDGVFESSGAVSNIVTWGVFRAKEIVSPTIVERESFQAWGEEAFAIWREWSRCFQRGSPEAEFLERMRSSCVLVNLVSHNYVGGMKGDGGSLWQILQSDC